jgi:hypothetical protein
MMRANVATRLVRDALLRHAPHDPVRVFDAVAEIIGDGTRQLPDGRRLQQVAPSEVQYGTFREEVEAICWEWTARVTRHGLSVVLPLFVHFDAPLWVPEVGGPIDPNNEAHDLIMSVFGGMSKGERNRIKVRVRSAMAAQAQMEGRFLGGRPPYGYELADLGPHPNPAKAADGRRLHGLAVCDGTAPVVQRIFAEFLEGSGLFAIAQALTRDDVPSPSAQDPARNRHRSGVAWSKGAVRAILTNPATPVTRCGTSSASRRS